MRIMKLSVFALMFILAGSIWVYAQAVRGAVTILNSVQDTIAMEKAVQDLTREGRYHERCSTDLGSVILLECGPITGLPVPRKTPHFAAQVDPGQHLDTLGISYLGQDPGPSINQVEPHVTVSLRNLGEGPHVHDMTMPVYPPSNLNQLIEGLVVVRVKVRKGRIENIQVVLPRKNELPPPITGPISGRRPEGVALPRLPISRYTGPNRMFVESVTTALRMWEFRIDENSDFEVTAKFSLKK